jgi:hypothetical protein
MPELAFEVVGAEPERVAAAPLLMFKLRIADKAAPAVPIHTVALRCHVRIEPGRRHYSREEQQRLVELFGTPERWGQTLRPMLWTHTSLLVPAFTETADLDLPVPCSFDFALAATKYFDAVQDGELPLCFLFSGTIFYASDAGALQVAQIPWDRDATYRLPAATWRRLMNQHYGDTAWLNVRKDVFDRLSEYKRSRGLITWEDTLGRLLTAAEEPTTP